jgi:hypothetical protein
MTKQTQRVDGWISVDEVSPDDHQSVLIHSRIGQYSIARLAIDEPNFERWWIIGKDVFDYDYITHWQPLPAPPGGCDE